jgi:RNA polymerase sigma-70 factor (ECF subfamily)
MHDSRERFGAIALPFMRNVYGAALRMSGKRDVADDVTQETYLRAYRTFDRFEPGTDCKAWLLTIMHSVLINRYRHAQRHPETALDAIPPDDAVFAASDARITAIIDQAPTPEIEAALAALPENFREAIVLVDVEELSYEEASRVLQCPVGTVRSRLFRARGLLFAALQEHAQRAGYAAKREPS